MLKNRYRNTTETPAFVNTSAFASSFDKSTEDRKATADKPAGKLRHEEKREELRVKGEGVSVSATNIGGQVS